MPTFVCVLDFEATCQEGSPAGFLNEIIEFPSVLLKLNENGQLEKVSEFQVYVKPTINPILSKFCAQLTGITQKQVDEGVSLEIATKMYMKWLLEYVNFTTDQCMIWTCGQWDCKICAPADYLAKHVPVPSILTRFVNVKFVFERFYKKKSFGMTNMLRELSIVLEGKHHSGIDDCRNIAKIIQKMVEDGLKLDNKKLIDVIRVKN